MADVFISYKSEERARILPLARALETLGYTVWWDLELVPGEQWKRRIKEELDAARCVVVVWTVLSVAENGLYASEWIEKEAGEGHHRGVLVPVLLDKGRLAFEHKQLDYANLTDWTQQSDHGGFRRLVRGLVRHVGERAPPPDPELTAWAASEATPGAEGYRAFLAAWPQSRFAPMARVRAMGLEEAGDWTALGLTPRPLALGRFLRKWPEGRYADEAEARIEAADHGSRQASTAVFEGRSSGDALADLRETWRQFPAPDDPLAIERFLTLVRATPAAGGLAFLIEHHLDALRKRVREADIHTFGEVIVRARDAALASEPVPRRTFRIDLPGVSGWPRPEMVVMPPGRFIMGSPGSEERWSGYDGREEPVHEVEIGYPFAIGRLAVTVDTFSAFVSETKYETGASAFTWDGKAWVDTPGKGWRDPGFAQGGAAPSDRPGGRRGPPLVPPPSRRLFLQPRARAAWKAAVQDATARPCGSRHPGGHRHSGIRRWRSSSASDGLQRFETNLS